MALGGLSGRQRWTHDLWRFQRTLRWFEYRLNTRRNGVRTLFARVPWRRQSRRLGFTIPPNVFGPGLSIPHYLTVVVNEGARVGANCCLHVGVPTLGDHCYIGPGAKVFGPVMIGDHTAIGANAVVTKIFPKGGVSLGGVLARPLPRPLDLSPPT